MEIEPANEQERNRSEASPSNELATSTQSGTVPRNTAMKPSDVALLLESDSPKPEKLADKPKGIFGLFRKRSNSKASTSNRTSISVAPKSEVVEGNGDFYGLYLSDVFLAVYKAM